MNQPEAFVGPPSTPEMPEYPVAETAIVYSAISATVKKILQEKDLSQVLKIICEEACRILSAERSLVTKIRLDASYEREILCSHEVPQDFLNALMASREEPLIAAVLRNQKIEIFSMPFSQSKVFASDIWEPIAPRTICGIPLIVKGESYAVLVLHHMSERNYSSEDRLIAEAFGDLASIAIEKSILLSDIEGRANRLEIFGKIAKIAGSSLEPSEIFRNIADEIERAVPCDRLVIANFNLADGIYYHYYEKTDVPMGSPSSDDVRAGVMSEEVYETGLPLYVSDIFRSRWSKSRHARAGHRSVLIVPVLQDGKCIAHIRLASKEANQFTEAEQELVAAAAEHLGPAIRNAALYRTSQERAERLEIAGEISRIVGSELKPEDIFRTIVQEIRRVVPCDRCIIAKVEDDGKSHVYLHVSSDMEVKPFRQESDESAGWLRRKIYEPRRAVRIEDIRTEDIPLYRTMAEYGFRGSLNIPIIQDGVCIAHIALASLELGAFTSAHEDLLMAVASHLGPAIRNAMLQDESMLRGQRLSSLLEISQRLTRGLALSEVLNSVVEVSAELFGGVAGLRMREGEYLKLVASTEKPGGVPIAELVPIDGSISGKVLTDAEAFVTRDLRNDPDAAEIRKYINPRILANEMRAVMCVPVSLEGRSIGTLHIRREPGFEFDHEAVRTASTLADQAAIAIENARLHEEAQWSRNFFESVVGDSADPIIIVDPERRIIFWNSGAKLLYGYSREEVLGRSVNILIPEYAREETDRLNAEMFEGGKSVTYETERIHKDGTIVPISMTLSPVRREDGPNIANAGIHKDLTGRKRVEGELVRAKNEAEAANRAKSEFLSNMSHELRSPLNAVVGFSDILMLQAKEENTVMLAGKIKESGLYLTRLIEEILDLDRIEEGKVRLEREDIPISALFSEISDTWRPQLPDGFTLSCEPDTRRDSILCDPVRVKQVLNNLIENAVKYSPEGGRITLASHLAADELWVSVQDQGMGIPPGEQKNIFERFQQLESGYKRSGGGLGIGLSLSSKLVDLHGGRIWVESEKGAGSKFVFSLPLNPDDIGP